MDYQKKILQELIDRYYKSKKDSGTNSIKRRTTIQPEKQLYPKYKQNDGSLKEIESINASAQNLESLGFITCERIAYGDEIIHIHMVDEKKEEIEGYIYKHYGIAPKSQKMAEVQDLIDHYKDEGPITKSICQKLQETLDKNKIPPKYNQTADVLRALNLLEKNESKLYQREFSMLVFGSSKYLEENVRDELCKVIRDFLQKPSEEDEMSDEILELYQVFKEPQKIQIKGPVVLEFDNRMADLGCLHDGVELSYEQIITANRIKINANSLITVENLTSYMRCENADSVFFYLGGHANRFQSMVLKKIYMDNPQIDYYHFGDIDAGGFIIHDNLCQKTGIDFQLLYMSDQELQNPDYGSCLQPLKENDISRLNTLLMDSRYSDTVSYMLKKKVKLEQEIISLIVYGKKGKNVLDI